MASSSNFVATLELLGVQFEATHGIRIEIVSGSTGKLYAQILAGAPYDVFLSADTHRPTLLSENGMAALQFPYALGRLVLWGSQATADTESLVSANSEEEFSRPLRRENLRRLALANPQLAPYGEAAEAVMDYLGVTQALENRLVYAENIGQAHAMVATGNAELGFTAQSYLIAYLATLEHAAGSSVESWLVPAAWHPPITQDLVWLKRAKHNTAAVAFVEFMRSAPARDIIRRSGYDLPQE